MRILDDRRAREANSPNPIFTLPLTLDSLSCSSEKSRNVLVLFGDQIRWEVCSSGFHTNRGQMCGGSGIRVTSRFTPPVFTSRVPSPFLSKGPEAQKLQEPNILFCFAGIRVKSRLAQHPVLLYGLNKMFTRAQYFVHRNEIYSYFNTNTLYVFCFMIEY